MSDTVSLLQSPSGAQVRVTDYYGLDLDQGSIDFVDVDTSTDVAVYIDPTAIRSQGGPWAEQSVGLLVSYFESLLDAIRAGDTRRLGELVYPLSEPNETHLGVSRGRSAGRSLGSRKRANELIESLRTSRAARSGFLRDLEDSAMMVPGIGRDIVSDIATCVIRQPLVTYTQHQCEFHGIPMATQYSGTTWNPDTRSWAPAQQTLLPRADDRALLLVPKAIVRASLTVSKDSYYRDFLRPIYEAEIHQNPTQGLIRTLRDGSRRVRLRELDQMLGTTKPDIVRHTEEHPEALDRYKEMLPRYDEGPIDDSALSGLVGSPPADLREILDEVKAILPGKAGANTYHRSIARLLSALFSEQLGNQKIEKQIHGGLKRIDVTYDNVARVGLFHWLGAHHSASLIVVECKNYGSDLKNPEFDQIATRFAPQRGQFGLLVCRAFENKGEALARAKALAGDGHGYVIVLDDDDLDRLITDYASATTLGDRLSFPLLRERFDQLTGAA